MKQLKILPDEQGVTSLESFLFKKNLTEDEEQDCLKLFEFLRYGFGEHTYKRFLKTAKYAGVRKDRNAIVLIVKNDFIKSIILQNYFKDIAAFVHTNCSIAKKIEIAVKDTEPAKPIVSYQEPKIDRISYVNTAVKIDKSNNSDIHASVDTTHTTSHRLCPTPVNDITFENFVFGESNKLAYWSAIQASEMMISNDNYELAPRLCIFGPVGMGKTHLMKSIVTRLHDAKTNLNIQYIAAEEFKDSYIDAVRNNNLFRFHKRFEDIDVLLLDDVQFISSTTGNIEKALDKILNDFINKRKWVVIACDRPPSELKIGSRTKSMLSAGLKASIQQSDFNLRMLILQSKLRRTYGSYDLPTHLLEYIAQNVMSSIRELEAILHNIMSYAKVMKVSIIRDAMVHEIVGKCDFTYRPAQLVSSISTENHAEESGSDSILSNACKKLGVRLDEVLGKSRTQKVSRARCVMAYLLRKNTNMTLKEIGDKLNRNHATVVYLINSVIKDESLLADAEKCQSRKNMM